MMFNHDVKISKLQRFINSYKLGSLFLMHNNKLFSVQVYLQNIILCIQDITVYLSCIC